MNILKRLILILILTHLKIRSWLEREELDAWIAKLKERINEPRVLYTEYVEGLFRLRLFI